MGNLELLGEFFGGLGMFFLGIAALWFVSGYKAKGK